MRSTISKGKSSFAVVLVALFVLSPQLVRPQTILETNRGKYAMVASQHELASKIGVDIMRKGGNAVDAAIAVGIALAVLYPEAGNIGGGGFMLIRKKDGSTFALDYREMAPAAAHRDIFVDEDGNVIRGEGGSTIGYRASGVPGTLAGFDHAHRRYGSGKVKWAELVEPARKLAEDGYILSHRLAALAIAYKEHLEKYPDSKKIFLNNGEFYQEGDLFKQPDLAQTLGRIEREGATEFYTGRTARLIAADMKANNGLITLEDLRNYRVRERVPIRGTYRGHEIISMPPPSSGGIVMMQVLGMLEAFDLRSMGHNSSAKYHLYIEASRRAFADRAEYMADPDFADVPVSQLLSTNYIASRRASIDVKKATPSKDIRFGDPVTGGGSDTTHYTVVDPEGNVVSNTYTINDLYGSRVTIKGTGILMNDEMDDFSARPGVPNLFGLIQGERNKVEGGKRPLSSMTPTIVLRKDGSVWFAVGARGGPRIISAVMQTVINIIDHDMHIQQAIDSPRIHHQWLPDEVFHEPFGLSPDTIEILKEKGHTLAARPGNLASATGIMIGGDGTRFGAIDSRSDGAAVGY
ncbi:MAG TPA: gamma-glutamyltransferase [Pyrinomonadaceae bacterium]|nr:gamma-glutamyltransferase [Pyrinomonadaceae bacterium]HMP65736.1 gamma-glutamyltransferase [Pyrinomonadaceae bacterium]